MSCSMRRLHACSSTSGEAASVDRALRAFPELPDEVLHDLAKLALRGIRRLQLTRVARTALQDGADPRQLFCAAEIAGDRQEVLDHGGDVLAHRHLGAGAIDDDSGVQTVPRSPPLVLAVEPGLQGRQLA